MIDIGGITIKELTEYADYCMGKIPLEERIDFPDNGRDMVNEVRCDQYRTVESAIINASPEDKSFIIDIYDSRHIRVMAARIWMNNGFIYLVDWNRARTLYDKSPDGIETFEEFRARWALPVVPKGILKIPERL